MSQNEMLDVVDENDIVLFQLPKKECYEKMLRVRGVNIVIIDPTTRKFAIQTRSKHVFWEPEHYCVSVSGHVGAGEELSQAAKRELYEEMGLDLPLHYIDKIPFSHPTGNFILGIYTVEYPHSELKFNPSEIGELYSMDEEEIRALIIKGEKLTNVFVPVIERILLAKASEEMAV